MRPAKALRLGDPANWVQHTTPRRRGGEPMTWQDRMDEAEQAWLDGEISCGEACEIADEMEER